MTTKPARSNAEQPLGDNLRHDLNTAGRQRYSGWVRTGAASGGRYARGLDGSEHKANNPAWTTGIVSPTTPSSSSGSPAVSARGVDPIVSLD